MSSGLLLTSVLLRAAYGEDGRPRGFAHVSFSDASAAAEALKLNGAEMDGRQVYIDSARERTPGGASGGGRSPSGALPNSPVHLRHVAHRCVTRACPLQTGLQVL